MEKMRKKIRLEQYNYSAQGTYFITICSFDRKPVFSSITPGTVFEKPVVKPSAIGLAIERNIAMIPLVYPEITVDKYVIMPNHIHLLISVNKGMNAQEDRAKMLLPKVIQSLKASVTKEVPRECRPIWQSRYYDHVIRNLSDFQIKWNYIDSNPEKWVEDFYYSPANYVNN